VDGDGGEIENGVPDAMVYAAAATALLVSSLSTAIACSVSVELTAMGPVYWVEDVVGVAPLVV
jgi:hypothetical protein